MTAHYEQCFKTQVKLARLRNLKRAQEEVHGTEEKSREDGFSVYSVDKQVHSLDVASLSANKLNKTVGCIIDTLLVLNKNCMPTTNGNVKDETSFTCLLGEIPEDEGFEMNSELYSEQPPTLTEKECSLLFSCLCVHGVPKLHARACALLIRLCGSQDWWGHFVTRTSLDLLSGTQTAVFNKER